MGEAERRLRQPIVVVLGHVDAGKTSLLDRIRGTAVQAKEAGGITQHIGASFIPADTLRSICGPLLRQFRFEVTIPGLLFIDTPGHEAFSNLRIRGGSAADLAILVVDATKGLEPQSYESIEILKSRKVPFTIALNKIDLITGWVPHPGSQLLQSIGSQQRAVVDRLDEAIYRVVGQLSQVGFRSEAFYRVRDFTREVAIVPLSARTGEGIPELLAILVGLAQQFLRGRLALEGGPGRGIVLEIREEPGLGHTANVILTDGELRVGDEVVLGTRSGAIVTRVRALLMPKPLDEMRDPRDRFTPIERVTAAAGVKLSAPGLEDVVPGTPIYVAAPGRLEELKEMVASEVRSAIRQGEVTGVVLKADALGSLEAIVSMMERRGIPVRIADIGPITKRDVIEASVVKEKDKYLGVVLGFNVRPLPEAKEEADARGVTILLDRVIYSLVEGYERWVQEERAREAAQAFSRLTPPAKIRVLPGYVFRRSNPAIFGIEVLAGRIRSHVTLMDGEGREVGEVLQVQSAGSPVEEARAGDQVAISVRGPTVGRQVREGDVLYTSPGPDEAKALLERYRGALSESELAALDEIIRIKRSRNPLYAVRAPYAY
ncbi:MAG: translation initiation factor IF-2 [Nitrososphaeria archaeon]